jgi:hypothetical protein
MLLQPPPPQQLRLLTVHTLQPQRQQPACWLAARLLLPAQAHRPFQQQQEQQQGQAQSAAD